MNHIEQLYLQIIHNTCTQTSSNITISQDVSISLINLAQTQSSLPFLLPYIKDSSLLTNIKYQTKLMMLNYYQIEQFTRRIADLFDTNNISSYSSQQISCKIFSARSNPQRKASSIFSLFSFIPDGKLPYSTFTSLYPLATASLPV